jgi:hypothetical protein
MIEWWVTLILMGGAFGLGYGVASRVAARELDWLADRVERLEMDQ